MVGEMSWSLSYIGTPENVAAALDAHSDTISFADSLAEYNAAKPHLKALVRLNVNQSLICVKANGHAVKNTDGSVNYSNCQALIAPVEGKLV